MDSLEYVDWRQFGEVKIAHVLERSVALLTVSWIMIETACDAYSKFHVMGEIEQYSRDDHLLIRYITERLVRCPNWSLVWLWTNSKHKSRAWLDKIVARKKWDQYGIAEVHGRKEGKKSNSYHLLGSYVGNMRESEKKTICKPQYISKVQQNDFESCQDD